MKYILLLGEWRLGTQPPGLRSCPVLLGSTPGGKKIFLAVLQSPCQRSIGKKCQAPGTGHIMVLSKRWDGRIILLSNTLFCAPSKGSLMPGSDVLMGVRIKQDPQDSWEVIVMTSL